MSTESRHPGSAYLHWTLLVCGIIVVMEAVPLLL